MATRRRLASAGARFERLVVRGAVVLWCMGAGAAETVTVVFTDVVGSTAWRGRVGDVVADVRSGELERASREVVTSSGGTVVKSLGDGVMATFTSAVSALEAAAALQAVARRLWSSPRMTDGVGVGDHAVAAVS